MQEVLLKLITDKPELLVTILSGFLLPISLVWLNNYYNLKSKNKEKELDAKYKAKEEIKVQEKAVYASLSKILFDVQQLHVDLSGTCISENCIKDSLRKFDESLTKCHNEISENMLYMSSSVINDIYRFYSKISDLKITLKELDESRNYSMAQVCVYDNSISIAETLIDIQSQLVSEKRELRIKFDRTQQQIMKYCCGSKPPQELFEEYLRLLKTIKPQITDVEIELIKDRWGKYRAVVNE